MPGMRPGTILGHEALGVVEEVGEDVRNLRPGDRVVIPSNIGCGACSYCRAGHHAPCDRANPNGPGAGTRFFGGPESTVRLRDDMTDDDAVLLADILPMSWFGARLAEVSSGDTVAVFGGGIVGRSRRSSTSRGARGPLRHRAGR